MYSEKNKRPCSRRAGDDFLRRMLGGDVTFGNQWQNSCSLCDRPQERREDRPSCHHSQERREGCGGENAWGGGCASPRNDTPACNGGDAGCRHCPEEIHAPSLASVYCPMQCFRGLYSPAEALSHGTLFAELKLPFYGAKCEGKEACDCGCGTSNRGSDRTHGKLL